MTKTLKTYLSEDRIDDKKQDALDAIENAIYDLSGMVAKLDELDRTDGASGAYDLHDQIATMDKNLMSLSDVVRRAQKIVPIEDTPADDKLSNTMGGNPLDSFPSIRGESVQELDRIKHLAGLTMESARGLLREYTPDEASVTEAGGYYTQPVYDMIEKHGYEKVMAELLLKLDADVIQDFLNRADFDESIDEGKMSDMLIHDSETLSKEEFSKKHGKDVADEYYEAAMGAPDYNPAKASAGGPGYASMPQQVKLAGDSIWDKENTNPPMVTITDYEMVEEEGYVSVTVEHDGPWTIYTDSGFEEAISDMIGMEVGFSEQGMQEDGRAHLEGSLEMESADLSRIKKLAGF